MQLTEAEYKVTLEKYEYLKKLIVARRQFEATPSGRRKIKRKQYSPTDITFPNVDGLTLFHLAVKLGETERVEQLLQEMSADEKAKIINYVTSSGFSPMYLALYYDNIDLARLLMKEGATVFTVKRKKLLQSPEGLRFYDEQVKAQLKQAVASKQDLTQPLSALSAHSCLDFAAMVGDLDTLKNIDPAQGGAQLRLAIINNQFEVFKNLLDVGVAVDWSDEDKDTCLHYTAIYDRAEMADELLKRGANIDARNKYGSTPLFCAALNGKEKIFKQLYLAGASPFIATYTDENIFHAGAESETEINLDCIFSEVNSDAKLASEIEALKNKLTICDESVADFARRREDKSSPINQRPLLDKIRYYLLLRRQDPQFMSWPGICAGLTFLYHYYSSIGDPERLSHIIDAWVAWDGREETLFQKPKPPLDLLYANVIEMFEETLSNYIITQNNPSALIGTINQYDRDVVMKVVSKPNAVNNLLRAFRLSVNVAQLAEIIRILSCYPANTHIDILNNDHITGAILTEDLTGHRKFQYYNSNLKKRLTQHHSPAALANRIFYGDSREAVGTEQEVELNIYRFAWEQPAQDTFKRYLTDADMPTSKEDVYTYVAKSPLHFSQLHVAILSQDVRAVDQLLSLEFFIDTRQKSAETKTFFMDSRKKSAETITPLELIYMTGNRKLYDVFFKRKELQFDVPNFLSDAYRRDKRFVYALLRHPNSKNLDELVIAAAKENDTKLIKQLFRANKVDKNIAHAFHDIISDVFCSESVDYKTKKLIYEFYKDAVFERGNTWLHFCASSNKHIAIRFLLGCDPDLMHKKNARGVTAFEQFIWKSCEGPMTSAYLDYLPKVISFSLGYRTLQILNVLKDPIRSTYAERVCAAIIKPDVGDNQSLFKFGLLFGFVKLNDAVIVKALLRSGPKLKPCATVMINEQFTEKKYTALHYALMFKPANDDERKSNHEIISVLIQAGADLDIRDSTGVTCRELMQKHPEAHMIMSEHESLANYLNF